MILGVPLPSDNNTLGVSALAFSFYASVYQNRSDINCIIHIRTTAATAVSAMKCGLLPICQEACICGPISSHTINRDVTTNRLTIDEGVKTSKAMVSELSRFNKYRFSRKSQYLRRSTPNKKINIYSTYFVVNSKPFAEAFYGSKKRFAGCTEPSIV